MSASPSVKDLMNVELDESEELSRRLSEKRDQKIKVEQTFFQSKHRTLFLLD
jgi:hypothetical protein